MADPQRIQKVQEVVRGEVAERVNTAVELPQGAMITVTGVDASPDLAHADVYVSVWPVEQTTPAMEQLRQKVADIQQEINKRLSMRPVPKLVFKQDRGVEQAGRIEERLQELRNNGEL